MQRATFIFDSHALIIAKITGNFAIKHGVTMTTKNNYSDDEDKPSHSYRALIDICKSNNYVTNCQICGWYGYPDEKITIEFEGIRPEDEDGFVDKFTEYNYVPQVGAKRIKHVHKCNPKFVQKLVDLVLKIRNSG